MTLSRPLAETPNLHSRFGTSALWCVTALLVLLGLLIRIATNQQLAFWVDEPATGLAVMQIARNGLPMLPSGLFYTQGITLSYLAAPFALFLGPADLIQAIRWLLITVSVGSALAASGFVWHVSRSLFPVAIALFAIALDPNLILWSIYARPYGVLTLLTILITWCAVVILERGDQATWRNISMVWILVSLIWFATMTHIGIWMVVAGLPIAVLAVRGVHATLRSTRLIGAGAMACLAPVLLSIAGLLLNPSADPVVDDNATGLTGGHLLSLDGWSNPDLRFEVWRETFGANRFSGEMPWLIVAGFTICVLLSVFGSPQERRLRPTTVTLTALYWTPNLILVSMSASNPLHPRYLVHIAPLGYIALALAIWMIMRRTAPHMGLHAATRLLMTSACIVLLAIPAIFLIQTSNARMHQRGGSPDYVVGSMYVADRLHPGEQIFVSIPPASGMVFTNETLQRDVMFLAGGPETERSTRYVLIDDDGQPMDYWLGTPVINTTEGVCRAMTSAPAGSWLLLDTYRMNSTRYYAGPYAEVLIATSTEVKAFPNGLRIRRVEPTDLWDANVLERYCTGDTAISVVQTVAASP